MSALTKAYNLSRPRNREEELIMKSYRILYESNTELFYEIYSKHPLIMTVPNLVERCFKLPPGSFKERTPVRVINPEKRKEILQELMSSKEESYEPKHEEELKLITRNGTIIAKTCEELEATTLASEPISPPATKMSYASVISIPAEKKPEKSPSPDFEKKIKEIEEFPPGNRCWADYIGEDDGTPWTPGSHQLPE